MTREEAFNIEVGDRLLYKEYYAFTVVDIKLTTPNNLKHTGIAFVDKNGGNYNYKFCRKWVRK